jgi:hypothetical protein
MVQYELFISMVFQNFVSMFINFDSVNLWKDFEMLICIEPDEICLSNCHIEVWNN